jgi:hypothetical protein
MTLISRSTQPAQASRRWDPFTEFEDLQARMGQLMESAWSGLGDGEKGIWLIPGEADPDAIDACLHDGVLTVRVPKAARERPREIEVKVA